MSNANRDYFDELALKFHRAHAQAIARAKEERALQQALLTDPELQRQYAEQEKQIEAEQIKLQTEQLLKQVTGLIAESKSQLASLKVGGVLPEAPAMESLPYTPTLSAEEQYKQTIVTNMIALIKQRKMK